MVKRHVSPRKGRRRLSPFTRAGESACADSNGHVTSAGSRRTRRRSIAEGKGTVPDRKFENPRPRSIRDGHHTSWVAHRGVSRRNHYGRRGGSARSGPPPCLVFRSRLRPCHRRRSAAAGTLHQSFLRAQLLFRNRIGTCFHYRRSHDQAGRRADLRLPTRARRDALDLSLRIAALPRDDQSQDHTAQNQKGAALNPSPEGRSRCW